MVVMEGVLLLSIAQSAREVRKEEQKASDLTLGEQSEAAQRVRVHNLPL